jgi:RNA polymerase subunit RPABC4/transcription elongation factor Spt4
MEALIARSVQILIALGGAYILTLWFAIVIWTFQDIQARSRSVVAQIFSTLVVMIFSIPGLLIYMVLRPRYTLDDAFQRSLEEEYLMQDLEELPLCPGCQQYVEDDWVFCPNCRTELRDNCIACDQLIDLRWEICPFCGTEQYEDEDDALPAPVIQPVAAPSPQYLGRPHLTQTEVFRLQDVEERTRPIIPATVRVDLRSGDVLTEPVPELPISLPLRPSNTSLPESRRVTLSENGDHSGPKDDELNFDKVESTDSAVSDLTKAPSNETVAESLDPESSPGEDETMSSEADSDYDQVETASPDVEQPLTGASETSEDVTAAETSGDDASDAGQAPVEKPKKRRKRRRKSGSSDTSS